MGAIAIEVRSLTKEYRIGHRGEGYRTLRESLASIGRNPLRAFASGNRETLSALRDVSFEVKVGEALGIIGRNGAGKSTLLKVLARITAPTSGRALIFGRVGSLLEVGTGFHPELTGRENVYLNGSILGMSRADIGKRFDEIVAFAETERFLDTPVKHYSTGMYLRLAFAVAAHLDTDILLVDEVLAVGDAAFQAKCLGKMRDVSGFGRTVVFVSHNLAAVSQLCQSVLLLENGRRTAFGDTDQVIGKYLNSGSTDSRVDLSVGRVPSSSSPVMFTFAEVLDHRKGQCQDFPMGSDITVRFGLMFHDAAARTRMALTLRTNDGLPIALMADVDAGFALPTGSRHRTVSVRIPDIRLYPGEYRISLWASDSANVRVFDDAEDCLAFRITDGGRITQRPLPRHSGIVFLSPTWRAE